MTARLVFESVLTELSKVNAPSLLLHEFNYYFNKAINQYVNKRYNIYDVNQQTTDDLRVLKSTALLTPESKNGYEGNKLPLFKGIKVVNLPDDYLHMLNCICIYTMKKTHKCYDEGETVEFAATKLSADAWSTVINDYYNRPTPEHPYYYIHNLSGLTDMKGKYNVNAHYEERNGVAVINPEETSNFPRTVEINGTQVSTVEKETAYRYGNASKVRCEIRYGKDDSIYQLTNVYIDYIKVPLVIRLTKSLLDYTEDTSQIMEFPDYVCQEIINELVILVMLRDADPRLQTQMAVSLSIAQPAQALTPQRSNS